MHKWNWSNQSRALWKWRCAAITQRDARTYDHVRVADMCHFDDSAVARDVDLNDDGRHFFQVSTVA